MKAVTLKDVASRAGVSYVTVSRVLSGKAHVADGTRRAVIAAARELKYRPNVAARSLVSGRKGDFPIQLEALFCHYRVAFDTQPPGTFQMQVLQGICDAVHADGHASFSLTYWREDEDHERQLLRLQRSSGVVVMGNSDRQLAEAMRQRGMKVVLADHDHEGLGLDTVVSDNQAAGRTAVRYLLERGHRRIGWMGAHHTDAYQHRLDGVQLELAAAGLPLAAADCRTAEEDTPQAFELLMQDWLAAGDLPPAIILCGPLPMVSVMHVMRDHGLRCPDDISLFSLDADAFTASCRPAPTATATYPRIIGHKAMERLIAIVRAEEETPPLKTVVPMRLVEGGSVASVAAAGAGARLRARLAQGSILAPANSEPVRPCAQRPSSREDHTHT